MVVTILKISVYLFALAIAILGCIVTVDSCNGRNIAYGFALMFLAIVLLLLTAG